MSLLSRTRSTDIATLAPNVGLSRDDRPTAGATDGQAGTHAAGAGGHATGPSCRQPAAPGPHPGPDGSTDGAAGGVGCTGRGRGTSPPPAPTLSGLAIPRMVAGDDPQSFLEAFEITAAACRWPAGEWAVRVLPLLSGEAQKAALSLPAASRGRYEDVRRAVLDRLGQSREDHRRRFRATRLGPADRPFAYAQQLRDAATRWLQPGESAEAGAVVDQVVLEQFVEGLPPPTYEWVRCHRPGDLEAGVTLAEDHLAVQPRGRDGGGTSRATDRPTPAPRRRPAPPEPPRAVPVPRPRSSWTAPAAPWPQTPAAPSTVPDLQEAPQASGQGCWRCGQPGHVRRDCPLMEVGQTIRVAGPPAPSPGPGETYSVPVRIQGGRHQAMVDSGCMQSLIHQNLV